MTGPRKRIRPVPASDQTIIPEAARERQRAIQGWATAKTPEAITTEGGMTPADLRAMCNSRNDEHCMGGQTKLTRLLDWRFSTLWRKLNGKSRITQSDELAIRQAVASLNDACG